MVPADMFEVHLENTRALDRAFEIVARDCRAAIARENPVEVDALTKTCILLFGARMENRLHRLVFEPGAFSAAQRDRILAAGSMEKSWVAAVSEAFASRRSIRLAMVPARLAFTDRSRYDELVRLITNELSPIITLRNVLAHGQWHRALTADRSRVDSQRMAVLGRTRLWHAHDQSEPTRSMSFGSFMISRSPNLHSSGTSISGGRT